MQRMLCYSFDDLFENLMNAFHKFLPVIVIVSPSHQNHLLILQGKVRLTFSKQHLRDTVDATIPLAIELEVYAAVPSMLRINLLTEQNVMVRW